MVRVLSNGEVVSDDDPRVGSRQSRSEPRRVPTSEQTTHSYTGMQQSSGSGNPMVDLWNNANGRLLSYGVPPIEVAGFRFEPLHLVLAVIGLVMFGPVAALLVIAFALISQSSGVSNPLEASQPVQRPSPPVNAPSARPQQSSNSSRGGLFSGTGQKLGN